VDLEIRHYGNQPSQYKLYDDDGETYNYEKGEYSWRTIKIEKDQSGKLKGIISDDVKGKPNSIGNITWTFMTKSK
jgi:alpha-D-xyloside xylohydrolase